MSATPAVASLSGPGAPLASKPAVQPRRKRIATFSFKGVVAATTKDGAQRMRGAMEHLSQVVISTYKVCMDQSTPLATKHAKLAEITSVEADLITIGEFTRDETANCKVERCKVKMQALASSLEADCKAIREEFHIMRNDPHIYQKIFDGLLRVLENTTQFLREGHGVEMARVLDGAVEALSSVKAVRDASTEDELVDLGAAASRQCLDLLRAAKRLLAPQEETLKTLSPRLDAAHLLMQTSLPSFLQRCKERIEYPSDDSYDAQQKALNQLIAVLEEIIAVVKDVSPDYDSSFKDQVVDADDPNVIKLRGAVDKLSAMLTRLHAMESTGDADSIKSEVVDFTKSLLPDLEVSREEKAELVTAVRQGINDSHKDYFAAQKRMTELKKRPKASIGAVEEDEGSKDLIEAAKGMLSALSGVSSALAGAPELQQAQTN